MHQELRITKSRTIAHNLIIVLVITGMFGFLAMVNLLFPAGVIPLVAAWFWPVVFSIGVWKLTRYAGGVQQYFVDAAGEISGTHFMEMNHSLDADEKVLCFGYELCGRRFIRKRIPVSAIRSVEWDQGQAPGMAGRGANEWHIMVWYAHGDDEVTEERREWSLKPDQDPYVVEPADRVDRVEALGLSILSFLYKQGVKFKQESTSSYVRRLED